MTVTTTSAAIFRALLASSILAATAACAPAEAPQARAELSGGEAEADATSEGSGASTREAPLIAVKNARRPLEGLLTGGQPTAAQLETAAAAGFRTIINLRAPEEDLGIDEASLVRSLGMSYVQIPISGPEDLTPENAAALGEALELPGAHPVLLHCGSGNRVGALLAVKARLQDGLSVDEAMSLGRDAGLTRLAPAVREILEQAE